jgi:hypothetical protein
MSMVSMLEHTTQNVDRTCLRKGSWVGTVYKLTLQLRSSGLHSSSKLSITCIGIGVIQARPSGSQPLMGSLLMTTINLRSGLTLPSAGRRL